MKMATQILIVTSTFLAGVLIGFFLLRIMWVQNGWFGDKKIARKVQTTEELVLWQGKELCTLPTGTGLYFDSIGDPFARFSLSLGIELRGKKIDELPIEFVGETNDMSLFVTLEPK